MIDLRSSPQEPQQRPRRGEAYSTGLSTVNINSAEQIPQAAGKMLNPRRQCSTIILEKPEKPRLGTDGAQYVKKRVGDSGEICRHAESAETAGPASAVESADRSSPK